VTDLRIAKWRRWIEGPTIRADVLTMHLQRDAWREVSKIIQAHGSLPDSYWWEFMLDTYITTQAVAVRRQADTHRDVASLAKLLEQMSADAGRVTRDFWLDLWREEDGTLDAWNRRDAEEQWAEHWGGGATLDPAVPAGDLAALQKSAASVTGFVDKHIAHAEAHPAEQVSPKAVLKVADIHDAIDVIGETFSRYSTLFTASGYVTLVPVIQHDWRAIFREPWIKSAPARRT
jgi:hypothetical protein